MKGLRLGPARLTLRIYLVSVAGVVAALLGVFLVLRLAWDPRHDPGRPQAAATARHLARLWPSPPALAEELERLRLEGGEAGAVFRWDGTLLASAGPPPPPLGATELAALAAQGSLGRPCPGEAHPCDTAFTLGPGSPPPGYAVLGPGRPPPPPPGEIFPLGLTLVGLAVAAGLLGRSLARPLEQLARTAHALGRGDLSARTGISRHDELGDVARAFDEMAGRVVALLRAQTELVANVAHELRTPLSRIRVALDLAAEGDAAAARAALAEIAEDLGELERLVEDVLTSSRMDLAAGTASGAAPPVHRAPVDLGAVLEEAAGRFSHRHPERELRVEVALALPGVVGDAVLLRRVLDNLLDNARKYSAPGAPIQLRAAARGPSVVVEVEDRGEGIAPEDLQRLFTPFFRADPSRTRRTGGVGLGLSLSRRIAEAHGGTLVAESTLGAGTTMTLALPAAGP